MQLLKLFQFFRLDKKAYPLKELHHKNTKNFRCNFSMKKLCHKYIILKKDILL